MTGPESTGFGYCFRIEGKGYAAFEKDSTREMPMSGLFIRQAITAAAEPGKVCLAAFIAEISTLRVVFLHKTLPA